MHFLITAGGTREYIDPVRFISNASSGRMGYALARAALDADADVTLITAPTALKTPPEAEVVHVQTAAEMFAAVKKHFGKCDCLIMAAAVSDYTPARPAQTKLKKQSQSLSLELKPTADILKWAGKNKKNQIVVGFALEDKDLHKRAHAKLADKKLDMIVANTPAAIDAEESAIQVLAAGRPWMELPPASKTASAARIVRLTLEIAATRPNT